MNTLKAMTATKGEYMPYEVEAKMAQLRVQSAKPKQLYQLTEACEALSGMELL